MPVGTNGAVKAISQAGVKNIGYNLILANTYHLYLRPGAALIQAAGGLHRFSGWDGNILTDSGGFQIFSLASLQKITDAGISFRSHIDGSKHALTPEKVIEIQEILGSDILMPLDVCTPPGLDRRQAQKALDITGLWLARSLEAHRAGASRGAPEAQGSLFGIIQGNFYPDLRRISAELTCQSAVEGLAIGGLSVGEPYPQFLDFLALTAERLDPERPRYLMGIGTPEYILDAVENGIDIFDCVLPTRIARNGAALTPEGILDLKKAPSAHNLEPLSQTCPCSACRTYSRAYIHHLFKAREILGPMLLTEHNLVFLYRLLEDVGQAIREHRFAGFKKDFLNRYRQGKTP
jgi:queuine tRNA-ribosyltransferase